MPKLSAGRGPGGGSASSLTLVSPPRRVVTLEKKAEETFGFEIQVGAAPCRAALPTLPARTLLCMEGYF